MRLDIKPLSVNEAWQGRRYRTDSYKKYQRDIALLLRPMEIPEGDLEITINWGFSNMRSDVDNPVKCFIDCLQKKYGFNDSRIKKMIVEKFKVSTGEDYIEFELRPASLLTMWNEREEHYRKKNKEMIN